MAFFGLGKKSGRSAASSSQPKEISKSVESISAAAKAHNPLEEAAARVRNLEARLGAARCEVTNMQARLNAAQEAAVEALVRGEEPPTYAQPETELQAAQTRNRMFEEALARAKTLLRTVEVETAKAAQAELDERFAKTLRELIEHAARMAECHERLREIHAAAGGRYSPALFWPAFAPDDYYRQWLHAAKAFLAQSLGQEQKEQAAVNADCCTSAPEPNQSTAEHGSVEGVESGGRMPGWPRACAA